MKLDILVFGAHPDDVELGCGGTIISEIRAGKKTGIIDLTSGELGTRGDGELRLKEARRAQEAMGVLVRENLFLADGFFTHSTQNLLKVIEMVRKYQPEIVLANAVSDRHPDHGRAARLVAEACFLSGLAKLETSIKGKWQHHWRPKHLFHYIQDHYIKPDFVVDISSAFHEKMEAIRCFDSQFFKEKSEKKETETPISGRDFMDFLEGRAREMGRSIGVEFGEGFTSSRALGVSDLWSFL